MIGRRPVALLVAAAAGVADGFIRTYDKTRKMGPAKPSTWYEGGLVLAGAGLGMTRAANPDLVEPLVLSGIYALSSKGVGALTMPKAKGAPDLYPWGDTGLTTGLGAADPYAIAYGGDGDGTSPPAPAPGDGSVPPIYSDSVPSSAADQAGYAAAAMDLAAYGAAAPPAARAAAVRAAVAKAPPVRAPVRPARAVGPKQRRQAGGVGDGLGFGPGYPWGDTGLPVAPSAQAPVPAGYPGYLGLYTTPFPGRGAAVLGAYPWGDTGLPGGPGAVTPGADPTLTGMQPVGYPTYAPAVLGIGAPSAPAVVGPAGPTGPFQSPVGFNPLYPQPQVPLGPAPLRREAVGII